MDEFTGGVDLGFTRDLTVRLNVVRKLDWGGNKELDLAQPFEAFTDRVHRRRSRPRQHRGHRRRWRRRGVVGAAHVSDVRPGQPFTTNTAARRGRRRATGRSKRPPASATRSAGRSSASYSMRSPRRAQHRRAQSERGEVSGRLTSGTLQATFPPELPQTYQGVRLSGTYELPWQILVASTFTGQQGEYFPRIVQVRNALESARRRRRRRPGRPLRLGEAAGLAAVEDRSGSAGTRSKGCSICSTSPTRASSCGS